MTIVGRVDFPMTLGGKRPEPQSPLLSTASVV